MHTRDSARLFSLVLLLSSLSAAQINTTRAETLEQQLLAEEPAQLAAEALRSGDPARGAILFHQPYMACTQCHRAGRQEHPLGPDLAKPRPEIGDAQIVESVLQPSNEIDKAFASVTVLTVEGEAVTGLIVSDEADRLVLRDVLQRGKLIVLREHEIEQQIRNSLSIMPAGQVNQLASRRQFLDLIRYLIEIRDGGPRRAAELEPAPSLYAARPFPEYEHDIDHAAMIDDLGEESLRRCAAIYSRLCVNCHGTHDQPGSLPTSLRFATGRFKNGADPFTMYQTLTRGFGMMVPQTWMVPQQKYDVIHYVRETYLRHNNPTQYVAIDQAYLDQLPSGTTRGPEPSEILPWEQMDYGPNLIGTYELAWDTLNLAYKGIAVRLDPGPGGVSHGRHWIVFDHDTMRVAGAWSGEGFIDWHGIHFDGRHSSHPKNVGRVEYANPVGPGWANPEDGSFVDRRLRGRDDRMYGPLPRRWAHYKGL